MTSPNTKKELIDFLWEWAIPRGAWSQILVDKITGKQSALDNFERKFIFDHYLQDIGFRLPDPLPSISITKPEYFPPSKKISLTKLSNIKGVNRLAENQVMEFSPHLTIVYGNNGVGKTGYSRILKSLGFSFDRKNNILSNVKEKQIQQSARIDFINDGDPFYFDWVGGSPTDKLNAISVFNSNCVNISLLNRRELLVSPQGFYLFKLVKDELAELNRIHSNFYTQYPITILWKDQLTENTPQYNFINTLAYNSELEKLNELSQFTELNQVDLTRKEDELKDLNSKIITANLKNVNLIISEISRVIVDIENTKALLTKDDWEFIIKCNSMLEILNSKAQLSITKLAKMNNLELFKSNEFITFLRSADAYIKLLNRENYPNNSEDTCVYCKQKIQDEQSRNLIDSYIKVLNDTTQSEIAKYIKFKQEVIDRVLKIKENIVIHQPLLGVNENGEIIQSKEIIEFNSKVKLFKNHIIKDTVNSNFKFDINYTIYIAHFKALHLKYTEEKNIYIGQLNNLSSVESKLKNEIAELKDRKMLSKQKQEIIKCINNFSVHRLLDRNRNKFNTDSLSRKTTEARQELVANDFQQKFINELVRFRKKHLEIDIGFYTDRGTSHINQQISSYNINDILSEGEQKAIALAEFLTELQLDNNAATVVFDDPVNSLDHHIIDDTARRLIDLSRERQVVVFTHSILLYNNFFSLQKNIISQDLDFKFYNVYTNKTHTGILQDGIQINSVKGFIRKINVLLSSEESGRLENEIAEEGYGYLRSALELFVTDIVFQNTVKRYRKNIMMTKLPEVKGDLIEKYKANIDELFSRASGFITGHSDPTEVHTPPTINDLKSDFILFKEIKEKFIKS